MKLTDEEIKGKAFELSKLDSGIKTIELGKWIKKQFSINNEYIY